MSLRVLFISAPIRRLSAASKSNAALSVWLKERQSHYARESVRQEVSADFLAPCLVGRFLWRSFDAVLLGDGVLSVVGWPSNILPQKAVLSVIHGLDITSPLFYQALWVRGLYSQTRRTHRGR